MQTNVELAKRLINAFRHYGCFIFESDELEFVKNFVKESGLNNLLILRRVDPRYERLYILLPWSIEFHQDCVSRVHKLLAEGSIDRNSFKKNYVVMVEQCIRHYIRERIKEVINRLEDFLRRVGEVAEPK